MTTAAVDKRVKWKAIHLVSIYRMVRLGFTDGEIAKSLNVSMTILWKWRKEKEGLQEAWDLAVKEREEGETLPDWIFSRLTPELQDLWRKIQRFDRQVGGGAKIEILLSDKGKRVRQRLFLHALASCRFNATKALTKVNVTKKELDVWTSTDPDFAALVEEIEWHKANFFESALVGLIERGDAAATMFANKTFNQRRGYGTTLKVEHSGQVDHRVFDLASLIPYLKEDTKQDVFDALHKMELDAKKPEAPDVDYVIGRAIANV